VHALPNAISPTVQVLALTFAYLAGGTVMIEYVFGYAGLGQGLMNAIEARDIPIIQAIVLLLGDVLRAVERGRRRRRDSGNPAI